MITWEVVTVFIGTNKTKISEGDSDVLLQTCVLCVEVTQYLNPLCQPTQFYKL